MSKYIPEKYITTADAFDSVGITEALQKTITDEERKRYQEWVREANNKVEIGLFPDSDVIPITDAKLLAYVKSAAIDWVTYKKRSWQGSANSKEALDDFKSNLEDAKTYLQRIPSERTAPIQEPVTTDFGDQYQIAYSQTQGYPPDFLY